MYHDLNFLLKDIDHKAVPFAAVNLFSDTWAASPLLKTVLVSGMQAVLTFLNTFLKYLLMNQRKSGAFYKHPNILIHSDLTMNFKSTF